MSYLYILLIFFFVSANAIIDGRARKNGCDLNKVIEANIFSVFSIIWSVIFVNKCFYIPLWKWVLFCFITMLIIRSGWYHFISNIARGVKVWYVDENDDNGLVAKIDFRFACFILSIVWLFTHKYFLKF